MSQTIRRELRTKFNYVLKEYRLIENDGAEASTDLVASMLADAALEVRGIAKALPPGAGIDWSIAANLSSAEIAADNDRIAAEKKVTDLWESVMGYQPLPWENEKDLQTLKRFLLDKTEAQMRTFAAYSRREFSPLNPVKARTNPRLVIETWNIAVPEAVRVEPKPLPPDPNASKYVPMPEHLRRKATGNKNV